MAERASARWLPLLLAFEAATFALAALVHSGVVVSGYEHSRARMAETVITLVLLAGFIASLRGPWRPRAALGAQAFALFGTLVGVFTIIVGVGPRTLPDVVYHLAIIAVLANGTVVAWRATD